ncbi:MAG: FliG C-terminal domain-containing protein [Planctomycetia bacterium]|nr:FliG C-terminal domain-containing protein [Planctomycetia bacterium]
MAELTYSTNAFLKNPSARWILGGFLVLAAGLGILLSCLTHPSGKEPSEALFCGKQFNSRELIPLELAFASACLKDYRIEGGRILVPESRREAYLQVIRKEKLLEEEKNTPGRGTSWGWISGQQLEEEKCREIQERLSRELRQFRGMESASVMLAVSECRQGFSRQKISTASVRVHSQADYSITESDIRAIRHFVTNAVVGLKPENVVIIDTRTNRSWLGPGEGETHSLEKPAETSVAYSVEPLPPVEEVLLSSHEEKTFTTSPRSLDEAAIEILEHTPISTEVNKPIQDTPHEGEDSFPTRPLPMPLMGGIGGAILFLGVLLWGMGRSRKCAFPQKSESDCPDESWKKTDVSEDWQPEPTTVVEKSDELEISVSPHLLEQLNAAPTLALAQVLEQERPQTAALVLSVIDSRRVSEILDNFSPQRSTEIVHRLTECQETNQDVLEMVLETILEHLHEVSAEEPTPESLLPSENGVPANSLTFQDLASLSETHLREVLRQVPAQEMLLALVGASPDVLGKILQILPRPEAEKVASQLNHVGQIRLRDVEEARNRVMEYVHRMMLA